MMSRIGGGSSTGPKLFCVSGRVANAGVYEVPFGATLGELLALAGGLTEGKSLATVLLGGAAGSFVGPEALAMPLTFEATRAAGTTLGSGVVMVFAEGDDLWMLRQFDQFAGGDTVLFIGVMRMGPDRAIDV